MKDYSNLTRDDIRIARDMQVDGESGKTITCYIETWFDTDRKFGTNVRSEPDTWINLYGHFNPFEDTLEMEYEIDRPTGSSFYDYEPTDAEAALIKKMVTEKIMEEYGQTPQEFCTEW